MNGAATAATHSRRCALSLSCRSDDDLLVAIQHDDTEAADELEARFGPLLEGVARRRCRVLHLPIDHVEDIMQEVYRRVLDPDCGRFDPVRMSAQSYLGGLAFNAAKALMLTYRDRAEHRVADDDDELLTDPVDELVDERWASQFDAVVTRDLFAAVLRNEAARVQRVVMRHYFREDELQSLATHEGVSTFKLSRELRGFYARAGLKLRQPSFATVAALGGR